MIDTYVRSVIDTGNLNEVITSIYNVGINRSVVLDNGDVKFSTDDGIYIMKELNDKETYVYFTTGIYEFIVGNGFRSIAHILPSITGKYYAELNGRLYMAVRDVKPMNKLDYFNNINRIVHLIGDFHRCSLGFIPSPGAKPETSWGKWTEKYRKKLQAMRRYRYLLNQKADKTIIEKVIFESMPLFLENAEAAIKLFSENNYLDTIENSMIIREVSLDCVKPSNLYEDINGPCIRSLNNCKYEIVERDIADMIIEFIGSGGCGIEGLLNEYCKVYKININRGIIKAFLIFPERFIKICLRCREGRYINSDQLLLKKLEDAMTFENIKKNVAETI